MDPTIRQDVLMGGRSDFARLSDTRPAKVGIEVGTDRGCFAREFLDKWHGEMFYLVDPYRPYPHMPWDRTSDMALALLNLQPHASRIRFLRMDSREASALFLPGGSLHCPVGFIYIDGAHDFASVEADLAYWWPVLAKGGVFAGDDFNLPEVAKAVYQFATKQSIEVIQTVPDYNRSLNWWFSKP